ncbi:MAG: pirin [bacterium]|nr:pirin [bacterium]
MQDGSQRGRSKQRRLFDRLHGLGPERARAALGLEAEEARDAGALGFLARILVQATLPHRRTAEHEFERSNGHFSLHLHAPPSLGLPYGSYPRLVLAWLNTEAVRTRSRHLHLGRTFTSFMAKLGLPPVTGKRGTAVRLRGQLHRLFSTSIRCSYGGEEDGHAGGHGYMLAHEHELWWSPRDPGRGVSWSSSVTLSTDFYEEIVRHAVPVDLRALRFLKRSALALDIYAWLTYRLSYLSRPLVIPWAALEDQFGADYARPRDFRRSFREHLVDVVQVYPGARVKPSEEGLTLAPSRSHVRGARRRS